MDKTIDPSSLKVPVVDTKTGKTVYETFNPSGKQSDGSQWFVPETLIADDHIHYFKKHHESHRKVICDCGFGGDIYPHNAQLVNGQIVPR